MTKSAALRPSTRPSASGTPSYGGAALAAQSTAEEMRAQILGLRGELQHAVAAVKASQAERSRLEEQLRHDASESKAQLNVAFHMIIEAEHNNQRLA